MNKGIIAFLVIAIVAVQGRQWFHDVKATSLNPQLFDQLVGKENHYFIEFFTPWCGYCQQMAGEWNKLFSHYEESSETRNDVKIAKINCDDNQKLCLDHDVRQFPTIFLYKAGSKRVTNVYQGWRRFEDFKEFIETQAPQQQVQQPAKVENEDQIKAQQQREEERKLKEQEELIRQQEEAIERQHQQQLLLLQRQEEEDRQRREQEERVRQEAEQKIKQLEEERIKLLQEQQNKINSQNNQQEQTQNQNNNSQNDQVILSQINLILQQTRSIQHQIQQVPQIQTLVHQLKVNLDYTIQKVDIVEQYLKHQKEVSQTLYSEVQQLQAEIKSLKQNSQEKGNEGNQQQQQHQQDQQQVKPDQQKKPKQNGLPVEKSFNILHSIVFIAVGACIGYIFFKFFSRQKTPSQLLISHDQLGKSN